MNRYFLTGAVILACCCIISIAYACVDLEIDSDYKVYGKVGNYIYVDAWVYEGGPAYQDQWNWTWPAAFGNDYQSDGEYDSTSWSTCDTAGQYTIGVNATGPNGYDSDSSQVYVIDPEIENNPPNRDTPEYIAYQTGMNVYYKIEPTSGWTPSEVRLYIKDSSSELIKYVPLSTGLGEQTAYWDGKHTRGWWAESGQYTAQIRVRIYGTYIWSDTHTFYVINVQITEPDGDPDYDHQFAFEGANAICIFDVDGETGTGITALDNDLEWGLEPLGSTFCEWKCEPNVPSSNPNVGLGADVTFWNGGYGGYRSTGSYTYDNGDWGEKTLTLTHPASGFVDTLKLEIFFDPDVVIINGVPNWFYYWKDDGVVSEMSNFDYDSETSNKGYYDCFDTGNLYLGSSAAGFIDVDETFYNHYYQTAVNTGPDGVCDTEALTVENSDEDDIQVIDVGEGTVPYAICITAGNDGFLHSAEANLGGDDELDLTGAIAPTYCIDNSGIDTVALVCAHELKHQSLLVPLGAPCEESELDKTSDGDCVSNNLEGLSPYYLDPARKDTYNLGADFLSGYPALWQSDNEFLAFMAGKSPGSVFPNNDWSVGGKQWHID